MHYKPFELLNIEVCPSIYTQSFAIKNTFYQQFLELKEKIESLVPQVIVLANIPPKNLKKIHLTYESQVFVKIYLDTNTNLYTQFPRENAFEIYYVGECLHSKFKTQQFPNIDQIVNKIHLIRMKMQNNSLIKKSLFQCNPDKSKIKNYSQSPLSRKFLDQQRVIKKYKNKLKPQKQTENTCTQTCGCIFFNQKLKIQETNKKSNNINVNIIKINNKVILRNRSYSPSPQHVESNQTRQNQNKNNVLPTCKFIKWFQSKCLTPKAQKRDTEAFSSQVYESEFERTPKNHNEFNIKINPTTSGQNTSLNSESSLGNSKKNIQYLTKGDNCEMSILPNNHSQRKITKPEKYLIDESRQVIDCVENSTRIMKTQNTEDETPMTTKEKKSDYDYHLSFTQVSQIVQEQYEINKQDQINKFKRVTHRINYILILNHYFKEQQQYEIKRRYLKQMFLKVFMKFKMMSILIQHFKSQKIAQLFVQEQHQKSLIKKFIKGQRIVKMGLLLQEKFLIHDLSDKYFKILVKKSLKQLFDLSNQRRVIFKRTYWKIRILSVLIRNMFYKILQHKIEYQKSQLFKQYVKKKILKAYKNFRIFIILLNDFQQKVKLNQNKLKKSVKFVQMGLALNKQFGSSTENNQELSEGFKTERDILNNLNIHNSKEVSSFKFDSNCSYEEVQLNQSFKCVDEKFLNTLKKQKIKKNNFTIKLKAVSPSNNKCSFDNVDISFQNKNSFDGVQKDQLVNEKQQQIDLLYKIPISPIATFICKNIQESIEESQKNFGEILIPFPQDRNVVCSQHNQSIDRFADKNSKLDQVDQSIQEQEGNISEEQCSVKLQNLSKNKLKKFNKLATMNTKSNKNVIFKFNTTETQITPKHKKKKNDFSRKYTVSDRQKKLESRFEVLEQMFSSYRVEDNISAQDILLEPTSKAILLKLLTENKEKKQKAQLEL